MGGKTQGILVQSHVDNKPLPRCGTEKGDYIAGYVRRGAVRDGDLRGQCQERSWSAACGRSPTCQGRFKGLRVTGLLSPAKQRQREDRADFHIKGMEAIQKEERFQLTAFQQGVGLSDSCLASRQSQIRLQRQSWPEHHPGYKNPTFYAPLSFWNILDRRHCAPVTLQFPHRWNRNIFGPFSPSKLEFVSTSKLRAAPKALRASLECC